MMRCPLNENKQTNKHISIRHRDISEGFSDLPIKV